jgi:GT2 family glycosyltransferase
LNEEGNIFFSVVIPTYERPDDLRTCLNSLSKEIQQGSQSYEIIVTDDSKSDESRKMVEKEFPDVFWGKGKQNGPAGNRNAGVDRAKGKWIVFLDDDCIAQEGYLNAYAKAIKANPGTQVLEGRIFADRPRKSLAEGAPINEDGGLLWTSNLCIVKDLFDQIGGFNEIFRYAYEDVDLAYRIKKNGYKTKFIPQAAVCHPWRHNVNSANNWKKNNYDIESLILYLKIHPEEYKYYSAKLLTKKLIRSFIKVTLPGILEYKMNGILFAMKSHMKTVRTMIAVERNRKRI